MYIEIENEIYSFDFVKIMDFVLKSKDDKNVETQISQRYQVDENKELVLLEKDLNETKIQGNQNAETMRYDLVRQFIGVILNIGMTTSPMGELVSDNSVVKLTDLTIGETIAFNSCLHAGFLININK